MSHWTGCGWKKFSCSRRTFLKRQGYFVSLAKTMTVKSKLEITFTEHLNDKEKSSFLSAAQKNLEIQCTDPNGRIEKMGKWSDTMTLKLSENGMLVYSSLSDESKFTFEAGVYEGSTFTSYGSVEASLGQLRSSTEINLTATPEIITKETFVTPEIWNIQLGKMKKSSLNGEGNTTSEAISGLSGKLTDSDIWNVSSNSSSWPVSSIIVSNGKVKIKYHAIKGMKDVKLKIKLGTADFSIGNIKVRPVEYKEISENTGVYYFFNTKYQVTLKVYITKLITVNYRLYNSTYPEAISNAEIKSKVSFQIKYGTNPKPVAIAKPGEYVLASTPDHAPASSLGYYNVDFNGYLDPDFNIDNLKPLQDGKSLGKKTAHIRMEGMEIDWPNSKIEASKNMYLFNVKPLTDLSYATAKEILAFAEKNVLVQSGSATVTYKNISGAIYDYLKDTIKTKEKFNQLYDSAEIAGGKGKKMIDVFGPAFDDPENKMKSISYEVQRLLCFVYTSYFLDSMGGKTKLSLAEWYFKKASEGKIAMCSNGVPCSGNGASDSSLSSEKVSVEGSVPAGLVASGVTMAKGGIKPMDRKDGAVGSPYTNNHFYMIYKDGAKWYHFDHASSYRRKKEVKLWIPATSYTQSKDEDLNPPKGTWSAIWYVAFKKTQQSQWYIGRTSL